MSVPIGRLSVRIVAFGAITAWIEQKYAESGKLHRKGLKTRPAYPLTGSPFT